MTGIPLPPLIPTIQQIETPPDLALPPDPPALAPQPEPGPRPQKLARSQMRAYAIKLARQQGMICPLCLQPLDLKEKGGLVLDHDHRTGLIRGVLHRACNGAEGKVANAAGRWGARSMEYSAIIPFLRRLVEYLERAPLNVLYPFHKTSDEKRMDRNKAAREARAKRKAQLALKDKS